MSAAATSSPPLQGVRVLELTRLLPGPLATRHLADLGADIVKIEDTAAGDYAREMGAVAEGAADSAFFRALNRGKRALRLDLKHPRGKAVLRRLVESADVLVESFRPGVMDRLGLGYAALKAINPRLVYCAITGYGQDGPWRDLAGHDLNYLAVSGVLERTASADSSLPAVPSLQIGDLLGGALPAALSIVAALYGAQQSGQGHFLDIAMAEVVLTHHMSPLLGEGDEAPRGGEMLTGGLPWYGVYATRDGRHLAVGALEAKFWQAFCATVGRPDWAGLQGGDGAEREALRAAVADLIASQPLAYWAERFATVDACVTPVLTPEEALALPQFQARGLSAADELTRGAAASPFVMDGARLAAVGAPPAAGRDSRAILQEAGFDAAEVAELFDLGVV